MANMSLHDRNSLRGSGAHLEALGKLVSEQAAELASMRRQMDALYAATIPLAEKDPTLQAQADTLKKLRGPGG